MPEEAVMEQPVETPESASQPENSSQESTQSTPPDKVDRRQSPDALRKALKWFRENGQEHSAQAQQIERMLGEGRSYKNAWPTVRDAKNARQAMETLTGTPYDPVQTPQKLAEIQQYVSSMREVDDMLERGDPRVVDKIMETGHQGIVKILPTLIEKLAEANPEGMKGIVKPQAVGFMQSEGLFEALDAMVDAFNSNKPDEAKNFLARIINWAKGLNGPKAQQSNPELDSMRQENERLRQQTYERDISSVFDKVIDHAETSIRKAVEPYAKRYGLSEEAVQLRIEDVWRRIERQRNSDQMFNSGKSDRFNERTKTVAPDAVSFMNGFTDSKLDDAVAHVMRVNYGHLDKKKDAPPPGGKTSPVEAPRGSAPVIDYNVTRSKYGNSDKAQDAILRGLAYDSAGKQIKKVGREWKYA